MPRNDETPQTDLGGTDDANENPGEEKAATHSNSESDPGTLGFSHLLFALMHSDMTDWTSICWNDRGTFRSVVRGPSKAVEFVEELPQTDVWFGVNPVRHVMWGRGKAKDVTRLAGPPADLDFKENGCKSEEVAAQIIGDLITIMGTPPMAVVETGHGYQPYWPVWYHDETWHRTNRQLGVLLKQWGRLVAAVAARYDATVDSVFDLPRVLRVPGTYNCKGLDGEQPIPVISHRFEGRRLHLSEVGLILDSAERAGFIDGEDVATRRNRDGGVEGGYEPISVPSDWTYGTITCRYVTKIINAIPTAVPKAGRHQWMVSQCVKLVWARLGCITEADFTAAGIGLYHRLVALRDETGEEVPAPEVPDAMEYATEEVGAKTDDETRAELGDHSCLSRTGPRIIAAGSAGARIIASGGSR